MPERDRRMPERDETCCLVLFMVTCKCCGQDCDSLINISQDENLNRLLDRFNTDIKSVVWDIPTVNFSQVLPQLRNPLFELLKSTSLNDIESRFPLLGLGKHRS